VEADSDKTIVFARGELRLGILIEQMRREGFELIVSRILLKFIAPIQAKRWNPLKK
jgi:GTP-binding protein